MAISGLSASDKVYDATTIASLSGSASIAAIAGDTVTLIDSASATFTDKNVGTNKAVSVAGFNLADTDSANYNLLQLTGLTATITPADIAITGLTIGNQVYDASEVAQLSGVATVSALASDSLSLGGTVSASFVGKNVAANKAVTVSGYSLSGTDSANYNLIQPTGLTVNITPADIVVSGITAAHKVYDAGLVASLGGAATVTALANDLVTLVGNSTGAFSDKHAANNKSVTISGTSLIGEDAGNYNLVQPTNLKANISKADLVVTGYNVNTKVYDGNTVASLTGTGKAQAFGNDSVSLAGLAAGSFADKNAGYNKLVTITGKQLAGTDAGNYNLLQQTGLTGDITKASLSMTGLTAANKVYDASLNATTSGTATVNALAGDTVALSGSATAYFVDKNVGNNKAVAVYGYSLTGADANNYSLDQSTRLTANITKADLRLDGLTALNKTYDTGMVATLTGTARINALVNDDVTLSGVSSGSFANKNVGSAKIVSVAGNTLVGRDAGNYNLVQQLNLGANIAQADLVVTGLKAGSKVYDTSVNANLSGMARISALGNDSVTLGGSAIGSFADKNVGTSKAISIAGNTIAGTDASNYNLVQQIGLTGDVSTASLRVTGLTAVDKIYDAGLEANLTGTAKVDGLLGDSVVLGGTAVGFYADKNVGNNKAVTVLGNTLSGADASNYTLLQPTGLDASISKANLLVNGMTAMNKNYDDTNLASLTGIATVSALANDRVLLGGTAMARFADSQVAAGKAVTVTGYKISGTDSSNYNLIQPIGLNAEIGAAAFMSTVVANMVLPGSQSSQSDAGASAGGNSNGDSSGDSQSSNQDESDNQVVSVN